MFFQTENNDSVRRDAGENKIFLKKRILVGANSLSKTDAHYTLEGGNEERKFVVMGGIFKTLEEKKLHDSNEVLPIGTILVCHKTTGNIQSCVIKPTVDVRVFNKGEDEYETLKSNTELVMATECRGEIAGEGWNVRVQNSFISVTFAGKIKAEVLLGEFIVQENGPQNQGTVRVYVNPTVDVAEKKEHPFHDCGSISCSSQRLRETGQGNRVTKFVFENSVNGGQYGENAPFVTSTTDIEVDMSNGTKVTFMGQSIGLQFVPKYETIINGQKVTLEQNPLTLGSRIDGAETNGRCTLVQGGYTFVKVKNGREVDVQTEDKLVVAHGSVVRVNAGTMISFVGRCLGKVVNVCGHVTTCDLYCLVERNY